MHKSGRKVDPIGKVFIWIENICGPDGSVTKAKKNRALSSVMRSIPNPKSTPHQIAFALREASFCLRARLCFKSAGLIDCNELDTFKCMIPNCDKFLARALKSGVSMGRVSNEQSQMVHTLFLALSDSPRDLDSDDEPKKIHHQRQ